MGNQTATITINLIYLVLGNTSRMTRFPLNNRTHYNTQYRCSHTGVYRVPSNDIYPGKKLAEGYDSAANNPRGYPPRC